MIGKVRWFKKDYGFIEPGDGGKDVFVHISEVQKSRISGLQADDRVTFDIREGKKGIEACNIVLIK